MKLFIPALFLATFAKGQINDGQLEMCTGCLEDIDDSRDCLRECNNEGYTNLNGDDVSVLAECLTENGDFGDIQTLGELTDCCSFDRGCENDLYDVQECLTTCLDTCIKDDAREYLDCMRRETGSSGCELTSCLDGFLSDDVEDNIALAGSSDVFDLRNIADTVSGIEEGDVGDCELMRDFIETTCDIGRSCCDRCDGELGRVVGCLVNDIVIPFVAIEANTTIDSCNIDEQTCQLLAPTAAPVQGNANGNANGSGNGGRALSADEAELFNKAVNLASSKRDPRKEAIVANANKRRLDGATTEEEVALCEEKMRMDVISANMTHASNKYMECITLTAITSLEDTPEGEGSAASAAAKFVALAFSVGAALFF